MTCRIAFGAAFTVPVLPDTQGAINRNPAMFTSQLNWIVANKAELNIPIVLHVGDIIDWDTDDHRMWKTADEGFRILDEAHIPYALAVGNHDTAAVTIGGSAAAGDVHANLRITNEFNTFFPVSRLTAQQGRYEPRKSDSAWYTFQAGGLKWLVLTLELWPRQAPLNWAKTVAANHPDYNIIVLTHSYLTSNGEILQNNGGYGDLSPQVLYDQLVSQYPNILLVLSGHTDSSAWRNDMGINGNCIYQILQDYQQKDNGGGYIRLLEIDTVAGTIAAKMYSPYYNETKDDASKFTFSDVNFIQPSPPVTGSPSAAKSASGKSEKATE